MIARPFQRRSSPIPRSARTAAGRQKRARPVAHGVLDETPAVAFRDVCFSYRALPVLDEASFVLNRGSLLALTGGNGAGKSTLVHLLLGELSAERGTVELFGQDIAQFRNWNLLGSVPQQAPADYRHFPATVLEVVRGGLYAPPSSFVPTLPRIASLRSRHLRALDCRDWNRGCLASCPEDSSSACSSHGRS